MMLNSKVFNVNSPMIPFTKKELSSVICKNITIGYVSTEYFNLIETLKRIATAKQIPVTLNVNTIYNSTNNPVNKQDVLIKVEGTQTFQEYINNAISNDDNSEYINFLTYSVNFKDSVKELKYTMYKKFLWNYHNIDTWFASNNIGLTTDRKNQLVQDFDFFKKAVIETNDFSSFIDSCKAEDIKLATNYLINKGIELLKKHKIELNTHINNMNKNEEQIILNNPIILRIYMLGSCAAQCRRDWPKLKFSVLDKRSLDSIALWED